MDIIFFIGRILFGGFLFMNAYHHLTKTDALAGYAKSKGVKSSRLAVIFTGLLLILAGYTILTGVRIEWGIAALVLFFIPVTFTMHAFWNEEGQARETDKIQFFKNLAILGAGLMILMIPTPWPISLGN